MAENAPPGWYQSDIDPPGTERYWDGTQWSPETREVMAPPPTATGDPRTATGDPRTAAVGARITPHGRELASPGTRVGARLIDSIVFTVVFGALVLPDIDFDAETLTTPSFSSTRLVLGAVFLFAYEVGLTALKSATLGKMAVGIEVVRKADGQAPVGFGTAAMRFLPFLVGYIPLISNLSGLVLLASLILIFVDEFRRSVYDFAGQTYVVRKPRGG
jgi:uncharacterized RDD family membrane protein YckC